MPRKRTTRAKAPTKPSVTSVNAQMMSEQELKAKADQLSVILGDFDIKVATYLRKMERNQKSLELYIRKVFQHHICSLPVDVKKMTMKEYAEVSVPTEEATALIPKQSASKKNVLEDVQNFVWTRPSEAGLAVIDENEEPSDHKIMKAPNTAKAPATAKSTKGKRGKSTATPANSTRQTAKRKQQAPPSTRSTRGSARLQSMSGVGVTPANSFSGYQWGATPLITPKFDPNLPITPATLRAPRVGEIFVSVAGSPVTADRRRAFGTKLSPDTMTKCATIIEKEEELPTEERLNQIFQIITASLNDTDK